MHRGLYNFPTKVASSEEEVASKNHILASEKKIVTLGGPSRSCWPFDSFKAKKSISETTPIKIKFS